MTEAPASLPAVELASGAASLTHWGVIRVAGEDAAKFLQGQLSNDFALLGTDQARLAAYCSAKGRMLASFVGFKYQEQEILLLCPRDVLAPTLKRLSMFVLRAKARLTDATHEFQVLGLAGSAIQGDAALSKPWAMVSDGDARRIELYPAHGVRRQLWVAPSSKPMPPAESLDLALWQWGEVMSGVPLINAAVVEAFVPQMLNYESVGGVNFKKGCYPGQEVVARSQFRGTLKRRGYLAHSAVEVAAGAEVFLDGDPEQPAGQVVQAAVHPNGGWAAVLSLQISAAGADAKLQVLVPPAALTLLQLPYALLEDI